MQDKFAQNLQEKNGQTDRGYYQNSTQALGRSDPKSGQLAGSRNQHIHTAKTYKKTELSDVEMEDFGDENNRSADLDSRGPTENFNKENINTKNTTGALGNELMLISDQEFRQNCARDLTRRLRLSQPEVIDLDKEFNDDVSNHFDEHERPGGQMALKRNNERLDQASQDNVDQDQQDVEEPMLIGDAQESESVSLICQEKVDTLAEDNLEIKKIGLFLDQKDTQIEKNQDLVIHSQELNPHKIDNGAEGHKSEFDSGKQERNRTGGANPIEKGENIEAILKHENPSNDQVLIASPSRLKFTKSASAAPTIADNSKQLMGLIQKHQQNNNNQSKGDRSSQALQNQSRKSMAFLRTPSHQQPLKIFRNPVQGHQNIYQLTTQNLHASFGVNSEQNNQNPSKIESPDLPKVQQRRITMEPIKHDISTNTFSFQRQSPKQRQQDGSNNQMFRGTPQRTPQSRLRGFNQSGQRISLAQLSSSPVQKSPFRKRYSLIQCKPTMNNLKDQEENQSNDPYVRLLSANSEGSFSNTSKKNHFYKFLGTKGRSKAAYEKSSFDSPERIDSSIKKKPSMKCNYLNQFSNGKMISSNKKNNNYMSQGVKTPNKEQQMTNITPKKQNDYQTLQNNQDLAEGADDDKRFSSNTTKKFVTRMHGGSIIHSNFKVNHHSVQKNKIRRSDSKSKSKQTNSSHKDIHKMGICRQLQFDAEPPIQSPCFNPRDPMGKKFGGGMIRGGISASTANCFNMMTAPDRWTSMQVQGVQHQHFTDEKFIQSGCAGHFQQGFVQGPHQQRHFYESVQHGKLMGNWPGNLNTSSLSPHNNISSIFGLQHAQQMQQLTTRLYNPFSNSMMPRHQSSKKKSRKSKRKQSNAREHEAMDIDESLLTFPYIVQPIINIGGKIPSQLKKIYQISAQQISPIKRRKQTQGNKSNEEGPHNFGGKVQNDSEKSHQNKVDDDIQMHELGVETIGAKQRKRQRCNSSSETIKIYGPNESTQKQKRTDNSVISSSERKIIDSQDRASENSSSSGYTDEDDDDESSSSSPKYPHNLLKHYHLLQQQQEANSQFFGDNRLRLRLDDGILTAMPPQQQPHPMLYQHLQEHNQQQLAAFENQQHQTIFEAQNCSSPNKSKKHGQSQQLTEKGHSHLRHHHRGKMMNSHGIWQEDHPYEDSNQNNDSPITESTGKKHRFRSSLKKQRKREMKEKMSLAAKHANNPFFNQRNSNSLANYNLQAQGMMMPHYIGNENYQQLQAINFMMQPSILLGNINIVAGMNPHHQLNHHQLAGLTGYAPQVLAHNAAIQQLSSNAALNPLNHPHQMLFNNSGYQGGSNTSMNAKFGGQNCDEQQQFAHRKSQGREQAMVQTGAKSSKDTRQRKNKQSTVGKKRSFASGVVDHEFTEQKTVKHYKVSDEASESGVIQIRCATTKPSEPLDRPSGVERLQRQLTFSNTKNDRDQDIPDEQGILDDDEDENMSSDIEHNDQLDESIMVSKKIKRSNMNNQESSEMRESSAFKSPDQQVQECMIDRTLEVSQQKRTKSKSKKKLHQDEGQVDELVLKNLHTFNPQFNQTSGHHQNSNQTQKLNQVEKLQSGHSKRRSANNDNMLQVTPEQKSKMDKGSKNQTAGCQVFHSQTGQKQPIDTINIKTQSHMRSNGALKNGEEGSSLMNKLFGFNNQNASADKIQVQKFNQNGLMDSLNPVVTSQRNEHEQIRILNPQGSNMQQQPMDDHMTVSLSLMNTKKPLLTDQQQVYPNQSSFQHSAVKDYQIGSVVDKTTPINKSINHQMQLPNSRNQRHSSSKKGTSFAGSQAHLQISTQGKRLTQQEKEMQNHQNEENIRIKTEKIIEQTITQQELFAKPMATQCKGCRCKNTKCLKLYCECLRNNATCGPACQCTRQGGECHNNDEHLNDRKKAVEEILKRNIDAFESKVDSDKNMHFKGCKCKASECQKKYCECFERGVPCTPLCKCTNCKNTRSSVNERKALNLQEAAQCMDHHNPGVNMELYNQANAFNEGIIEQTEQHANNQSAAINDLQGDDCSEIATILEEIREKSGDSKAQNFQADQAHGQVADMKTFEAVQSKDIFRSAKIVMQQPQSDAPNDFQGSKIGFEQQKSIKVQEDSVPNQHKIFPLKQRPRSKVANPEEDYFEDIEQPAKPSVSVEKILDDQQKLISANKESKTSDRPNLEQYQDENTENLNTLNIQANSGNQQRDETDQHIHVKQVKGDATKKPTPIRKEVQPQDLSSMEVPRADWSKREAPDVNAIQDPSKKQPSQSSLTASKPISKSKRLSERTIKESARPTKSPHTKAAPPAPISAFQIGVVPMKQESLAQSASEQQHRSPDPPTKKPQGSPAPATGALAAVHQAGSSSAKRAKKPAAPQEKMQTRHQKKLLQKQGSGTTEQ